MHNNRLLEQWINFQLKKVKAIRQFKYHFIIEIHILEFFLCKKGNIFQYYR